jgi:mRNA interferase RelE/StbE
MKKQYNIALKRTAAKQLSSLPNDIHTLILTKIEMLADNPYPRGSKKLQGDEARRIRVGDYRILYDVDETAHSVVILDIAHRKEIYKKR